MQEVVLCHSRKWSFLCLVSLFASWNTILLYELRGEFSTGRFVRGRLFAVLNVYRQVRYDEAVLKELEQEYQRLNW